MPTRLMPLLALAASCLLLTACGTDLPLTTRDRAYNGPDLTIDSSGSTHAVVIQAPTPGYTVSLDAVRDRLGGREALISIRRPDPRFVVPQMIVTQRIGTNVVSATPLDVFVRQLPFDSRENLEYVFVRTTPESPRTLAP